MLGLLQKVQPMALTASKLLPAARPILSAPNKLYHLLTPKQPSLPAIVTKFSPNILQTCIPNFVVPSCGFKVKGRLRRRCKDCYFVKRQERLFVICETHPRHKQMAMVKKEKYTWILTHATQSKVRPW